MHIHLQDAKPVSLSQNLAPDRRYSQVQEEDWGVERLLAGVYATSSPVLAFDRCSAIVAASKPVRSGAYGWFEQGELTSQAKRDFSREIDSSRADLDLFGEALTQIPEGSGMDLLLMRLQICVGGFVLARVPECHWPKHLDMLLARSFGLTPAEVEIMRGVYEHSSLESLAKTRSRSIRTVRTQLSSVYAKTGLRSQADIVRFVAKLAA